MVSRREFLTGSVLAVAGAGFAACMKSSVVVASGSANADAPDDHKPVTIVKFDDAGKKLGPVEVAKVRKTEAEWRKQLTPLQFEVTRQQGTERAFTGDTYDLHVKGLFRCICCDNALFNSDTKFDSGTGWPSFWAPIAKENVHSSTDSSFGMTRDEISCTECDGHLGHVFDDGPQPTGLRYCMNSASMRFVKRA